MAGQLLPPQGPADGPVLCADAGQRARAFPTVARAAARAGRPGGTLPRPRALAQWCGGSRGPGVPRHARGPSAGSCGPPSHTARARGPQCVAGSTRPPPFARSVAGARGRGGDRRWPRPWHPAGGGDGGAERGGNEAAVTPRMVRRVPASGRVHADREREGHRQARGRRAGGLGRSSVPSLLFALQKSLRCPKPQLAHLRSGENARTGPRGP